MKKELRERMLDDPTNARRYPVSGPSSVKYATEASSSGEPKPTITKPIRAHQRIGAWNIRGMLKPGKLSIVEKEMADHRLSILGISETHMRGNGHFVTPTGNTMYFSGPNDSSSQGVGILLPSNMNKYVLGYNPISDRIISMKLNTKPIALNIVQVYAPTAQSSQEEIDLFYGALEATLDTIPNREMTMILGDWNAKVGNTSTDDHIRDIVGGFGLGDRNERGERLIDFCINRKLAILNTYFQHHPRRLYTWKSPGDRFRNQIDYIILNNRWRSSITNVKTFPGADCGSDHNLLVANFSLRLKAPKRLAPFKLKSLESEEKMKFQEQVEANLKTSNNFASADLQWVNLKALISTALEDIRAGKRVEAKKSVWISDNTWKLIQQRKQVNIKGLHNPEVLKEYTQLCRSIDKGCIDDRNTFINNICAEIEQHSLNYQTADLYKKVRLLSKQLKPKSWMIENANGLLEHELEKIAERWRGYCEHLYENATGDPICQLEWSSLILEPDVLRSEVTAALNSLKNRKAPGIDTVTAEILKSLGDRGIDTLHMICNKVWAYGEWPKDWTKSIMLPFHKKGSTKVCDNYRTLALISHASKVLLYILNNRIRYYLDWQIPQEQAGFVKGRGTREQILNVRQLIEKAYEFNTPVIMCFVDYSKAFDCVNWNSLWKVLSSLGVPNHLTALLQSLYYNSQGVVRIDHLSSRPFSFGKGVRQGCILSPILFNAYGEFIMRQTCDDWDGGVRIGGMRLTNFRYADDTTLLAASELEMVSLLDRMERISSGLGLKINRDKTKIMVVDRANQLDLGGALGFEMVDKFVYLGSTITNTGSCEADVRRRIAMAKSAMSQLHNMWKNRKISLTTKIGLVRTLVFSIFILN